MTTRKGKQEKPDSYVQSVQDMEDAEVAIIQFCQRQEYLQEITRLQKGMNIMLVEAASPTS